VIANGCLRKEARREHLNYINKGLLSKPNQGAKLALAHCDRCIVVFGFSWSPGPGSGVGGVLVGPVVVMSGVVQEGYVENRRYTVIR